MFKKNSIGEIVDGRVDKLKNDRNGSVTIVVNALEYYCLTSLKKTVHDLCEC